MCFKQTLKWEKRKNQDEQDMQDKEDIFVFQGKFIIFLISYLSYSSCFIYDLAGIAAKCYFLGRFLDNVQTVFVMRALFRCLVENLDIMLGMITCQELIVVFL